MEQNTMRLQPWRVLLAIALVVVITVVVMRLDQRQRRLDSESSTPAAGTATPLPPGSIPIILDSKPVGGFSQGDLEKLQKVSFTDATENRLQEGWLLRDIILLYVPAGQLKPDTLITVSSTSRGKSAQLTWTEVQEPANLVMFDLSNRGTLKLISQKLPKLDTRDEWVQDADIIEIHTP